MYTSGHAAAPRARPARRTRLNTSRVAACLAALLNAAALQLCRASHCTLALLLCATRCGWTLAAGVDQDADRRQKFM